MERKIINDALSVSGQISLDDVAELQALGIKSVICNRPDHEDAGQPQADSIQQAVEAAGMQFQFMPVISGQISQVEGEMFGKLIADLPSPIHAYCRSGTRCTILWGIQALLGGQDKESVIQQAAKAGYDLSRTFG